MGRWGSHPRVVSAHEWPENKKATLADGSISNSISKAQFQELSFKNSISKIQFQKHLWTAAALGCETSTYVKKGTS